jgi:predicted nucleotidyltransferase
MRITNVLDDLFSTWSHIAVLRVLQDAGQGLSGREIARIAGMSHRSCLAALTSLENLSVVTRQQGGRDHLFSLNRSHVLVTDGILPILSLERNLPGAIRAYLKRVLRKHSVSAAVFGSVARGHEDARSDFDVCVLVQSPAAAEAVREKIANAAPEMGRIFGVRVAPLILTVAEFRRRAAKGQPLIKDILRDGILIAGTHPKELLPG